MKKSHTLEIHVSPDGDDRLTGFSIKRAGRNGPKRTLEAVRAQLRLLRSRGELCRPVTVWLGDGIYHLRKPLEFGPEDSGAVAFRAMPGAVPVLDGGEAVTGFVPTELDGTKCFAADVSLLLDRIGAWKSLFIDGERAVPTRYPHEGWLWMESVPGIDFDAGLFDGSDRFVHKPGEIEEWPDLIGAEAVVAHFWVDEHMPITHYDPATRTITSSHTSVFALKDSFNKRYAKFYLQNLRAGFGAPGSWYLDREAKRLYIKTKSGRAPKEVVVPTILQLLRLIGREGNPVHGITFEGVTLRHTDWAQPAGFGLWWDPYLPESEWHPRDSFTHLNECMPDPRKDYANTPQAALHVPGAVHHRHARDCALVDCTIEHVGMYGVSYYEGCQRDRVEGCTIRDTGAGGINIDGAGNGAAEERLTGRLSVTDNRISHTGHVWISAVGILTAHSARNRILHNEIFDVTYSAISVGWVWGYADNPSHSNLIACNRIRDVAVRGGMADLGGIYTLGPQPGTMIRGNVICGIADSAYGGWGIYLDEGSAFITVEDNLVTRCSSNGLHEHFGRQNIVRNNVFAFGGKAHGPKSKGSAITVAADRHWEWLEYPPRLTTIERNIILTDGTPVFEDSERYLESPALFSDHNLFWDVAGRTPILMVSHPWDLRPGEPAERKYSLKQWRSLGYDTHSATADPLFADPAKNDFRLAPDSPAFQLGFVAVDWSKAGPRRREPR